MARACARCSASASKPVKDRCLSARLEKNEISTGSVTSITTTSGQAGIRGIRLNLATGGSGDPAVGRRRFQTAVERVKGRNWHVQMFTSLTMISAIKDLVAASKVPVVFDHFGDAQAKLGLDQPGFAGRGLGMLIVM